jgi:hypothetical protein
MMKYMRTFLLSLIAASGVLTLGAQGQTPAQQPPSQQPSEVSITLSGHGGLPPKLAVPDFIA